jgi:hypothetical protein
MDHICPEKGEGTITISRSCGAGLTSADSTILYMSILYINWYHGNTVGAGSPKAYQDKDYIIILIYRGCRIGLYVGVQEKMMTNEIKSSGMYMIMWVLTPPLNFAGIVILFLVLYCAKLCGSCFNYKN